MTILRPVRTQDEPSREALWAIAREASALAAELAALDAEIAAIPDEQPALLGTLISLTPVPDVPADADDVVIPLRAPRAHLRAVA